MFSRDVVLLIGDSRVAEMIGRLLEPFGARYELRTVGSGDAKAYLQGVEEYTDRMQYPRPNLLLLDLNTPSGDGIEVLEWIRKQAQFNDMPVVVLTGPNEMRQASQGYQIGANAFLTKPAEFGELRDVLLALEIGQTQEPEVLDIAAHEAPMVVAKSEMIGLREALEQTGFPLPIKALEDIESAKAHLKTQAGKHNSEWPLFVDLDLGEDAFELMNWVKGDPHPTRAQIIVLCKPGDIQGLSRAADSGAELFIVKPVTAEKLARLGERISGIWQEAELRRKDHEHEAAAAEAINFSRPGILYVADNPTDCHLFSTAMSQGSVTFGVEFLQSFAEVVECMRHKGESRRITSASPGCLLLDNATVGEASREVLRWVRNQSSFPEVPVVMFSDTDDPDTVKSVYDAGADYYLVKPKSFEGLLSIVDLIDVGLGQVPPEFDDFVRLPEYRDRFGSPPPPDAASMRCAE